MTLRRSDKRPERCEISPEQLVRAAEHAERLTAAAGRKTRVVGWYQSHPHIAVLPSHADLRTQLQYQGMDASFVGLIFAVFNADPRLGTMQHEVLAFRAHLPAGGGQNPERVCLRVEVVPACRILAEERLRAGAASGCALMAVADQSLEEMLERHAADLDALADAVGAPGSNALARVGARSAHRHRLAALVSEEVLPLRQHLNDDAWNRGVLAEFFEDLMSGRRARPRSLATEVTCAQRHASGAEAAPARRAPSKGRVVTRASAGRPHIKPHGELGAAVPGISTAPTPPRSSRGSSAGGRAAQQHLDHSIKPSASIAPPPLPAPAAADASRGDAGRSGVASASGSGCAAADSRTTQHQRLDHAVNAPAASASPTGMGMTLLEAAGAEMAFRKGMNGTKRPASEAAKVRRLPENIRDTKDYPGLGSISLDVKENAWLCIPDRNGDRSTAHPDGEDKRARKASQRRYSISDYGRDLARELAEMYIQGMSHEEIMRMYPPPFAKRPRGQVQGRLAGGTRQLKLARKSGAWGT